MAFTLVTHARAYNDNSGASLTCDTGGNGGSAGQITASAGNLLVATCGWESTDTLAHMTNATGVTWTEGTNIKNTTSPAWARAFYAILTQDVTNYAPVLTHDASAPWRGLIVSVYSAAATIQYDDQVAEGPDNVNPYLSAATLTVAGAAGLIVIGTKVYSGVTYSAGTNFTLVYGGNPYIAQAYRTTPSAGEYNSTMAVNANSNFAAVSMSFSESGGAAGGVPKSTRFTMLGIG